MTEKTPGKQKRGPIDTISGYARHRNTTRQYISKLFNNGDYRIIKVGKKIDRDKTDELLFIESAEPERPAVNTATTPPPTGVSEAPTPAVMHAGSKVTKEYYQGLNEKLKYEKEAGELIAVSEITDATFNLWRRIRDEIQALPDRVAMKVRAAESDHAATKMLRDETYRILKSAVDDLEADDETVKKKLLSMLAPGL